MAAFTPVPDISINTEHAIQTAGDRVVWNATAAAAKAAAAQINNKQASLQLGTDLLQELSCNGMSKAKALELMGKVLPLFFIKRMMAWPPASEDKAALQRKKEENQQVYGAKSFTAYLQNCVSQYITNEQRDRAAEGSLDIVQNRAGTIGCCWCL